MKTVKYLPKISVVTVVLNNRNQIEDTILSVINQTYTNIEYIIIDGGSTDGTLGIIEKYKNSISVIVSEPDKGLYDAMNKGTEKATGEWIIYMNSGDIFSSEKILKEIIYNYLEIKNKNLLYSDYITINSLGEKKYYKARSLNNLWIGSPTSHQSIFVKTSIAKNHLFDIHYKINADYDFIYKTYKKYGGFMYLQGLSISQCAGYEGISKTVSPFFTLRENFLVSSKFSTFHQSIMLFIINVLKYFYAKLKRI